MADCELLYEVDEPRIFTTIKAMHKMRYYIDKTKDEIGWLGYVTKISNNEYLIEDVFLLKQKVHAATTEIDPEALATMATELIKQGQEGIAKYNSIRVWGHSHVNMSTGASTQDDNQMKEFATSDYYIRLIGNKQGEWNVCFYDYTNNILWSGLQLELWYEVDVTNEELDKEIQDNVSKIEATTKTTKRPAGFGNYYDRKWYDNYYDDYYDTYGYGYPTYTKRQADRLREEEEEKEKEETPYEIDGELTKKAKEEFPYEIDGEVTKEEFPYEIEGELTKEDIRNMKRYYSSDADTCLFMCTALVDDVIVTIEEDYGVTLSKEQAADFMEAMLEIWSKRYADKFVEGDED